MTQTPTQAHAQNFNTFHDSRSVQLGLNLPHIPTPSRQDEIRAADGTICRSSTSNNGAYLDVGSIGNQAVGNGFESASVYGRLVILLGEKPQRLNCRGYYQLEIKRLRAELALVKTGLGQGAAVQGSSAYIQPNAQTRPAAQSGGQDWQNTGWSNADTANPATVQKSVRRSDAPTLKRAKPTISAAPPPTRCDRATPAQCAG
ncbi:MAG: hypothetical protein AAGJ70_03815 [Pseudomonadota bacterium]